VQRLTERDIAVRAAYDLAGAPAGSAAAVSTRLGFDLFKAQLEKAFPQFAEYFTRVAHPLIRLNSMRRMQRAIRHARKTCALRERTRWPSLYDLTGTCANVPIVTEQQLRKALAAQAQAAQTPPQAPHNAQNAQGRAWPAL
jgi:hypothetical protein